MTVFQGLLQSFKQLVLLLLDLGDCCAMLSKRSPLCNGMDSKVPLLIAKALKRLHALMLLVQSIQGHIGHHHDYYPSRQPL